MVKPILSPRKAAKKGPKAAKKAHQELWPKWGAVSYEELTEDNYMQRATDSHENEQDVPLFFGSPKGDLKTLTSPKKLLFKDNDDQCDSTTIVKPLTCKDYHLLFNDTSESLNESTGDVAVTRRKQRSIKRLLTPKRFKSKRRCTSPDKDASTSTEDTANTNTNNTIPEKRARKCKTQPRPSKAKLDISKPDKANSLDDRLSFTSISSIVSKNSSKKGAEATNATYDLDTSLDKLLRPNDAVIDPNFHQIIDASFDSGATSLNSTATTQTTTTTEEQPPQPETETEISDQPRTGGLFSGCLAFFRRKFSKGLIADKSQTIPNTDNTVNTIAVVPSAIQA